MEPQHSTKLCPKCNRVLDTSAFGRHQASRDGLQSSCKECMRAYGRAYVARNPERARATQQRYKEAHPNAHKEAIKRWQQRNPEKVKADKARFRQRRPTYFADYYAANKEHYREQGAAYYEANKKRLRPVRVRWNKANPDAVRSYYMKRRALKRGATIGTVDFDAILARDGWICHLCGDLVMREELSFDHIVPLNKGGAHSNENLAVAHNRCNKIKRDRTDVPSKAPPRIKRRG